MGSNRISRGGKEGSDPTSTNAVETQLLTFQFLLIADLLLNMTSYFAIHSKSVIGIFGAILVLSILSLITLSVTVLETRAFKLRQWGNLKRYRWTFLFTLVYFAMSVAIIIVIVQNNSDWIASRGLQYNHDWSNKTHAVFVLHKVSSVAFLLSGRVSLRSLSDADLYNITTPLSSTARDSPSQ